MQHTVSFEMAKKLKEAGWSQEGHFFFWDTEQGEMLLLCDKCMEREETSVAAPILTELLEALPFNLPHDLRFKIRRNETTWSMFYTTNVNFAGFDSPVNYYENPCDAAAELWLWCREKGYIK